MTTNFNKQDLAKELSSNTGYSIQYSKKIINNFLKCMIETIITSNLLFKNFGSFKILKKKERIGRNPKTKEIYIINARKVLKFLSSEKLKKYLNNT